MVWNDTTGRQGLVQDMEDICGLGATGITNNTVIFQQFTRWANKWAKIAAAIALNAMDDWDFDDPNWTTYPSGTYPGTTNRDYVLDASLKLLKLKLVGVSYDGVNYSKARPVDTNDPAFNWFVREDPNIDFLVGANSPTPLFDPRSNAIDIYPKFTAAQVALGAKVYIEFYREPVEFATTGTDSQVPGFASPFHEIISKGASYEYCKLYKPDMGVQLGQDIFGDPSKKDKPGIKAMMEEWYSERYPRPKRLLPAIKRSPR